MFSPARRWAGSLVWGDGLWASGGRGQLLGRSFSIQAIQDDEVRCCDVLHIGGRGLEGMGAHAAWNEAMEVYERTSHVLGEIGEGGQRR